MMKPEDVYHALQSLAEQLDITVSEQNLKTAGIHVSSGLCKVKGRHVYIMDKRKRVKQKVELLAECLAQFADELNQGADPEIKELLRKYSKGRSSDSPPGDSAP